MTNPRHIGDVLNKLRHVHKIAGGWQADCPCPGHDTPKNHLSIKDANDKALVTCFSNHSYEDVCHALGFDNLSYERTQTTPAVARSIAKPAVPPKIIATYDYRDAEGTLIYQVVRYEPKEFRQRRPDGQGGWLWNLDGIIPLLFMLPDIIQAVAGGETIFITEGEKDALSLWDIGLVATTNSGGAGKWRAEYAEALTNGKVVVIPDNDKPGRLHAKQVCESLCGRTLSLKVLEIPEPAKDFTEFMERGGDWIQFDALVERRGFAYVPGKWPVEKPLFKVGGI